jgi:ketosteroid isomerase-like protein
MLRLTAVCLTAISLALLGLAATSRSMPGSLSPGSGTASNMLPSSSSTAEIRAEIERFRQAVLHKDMKGVGRYYANSPDLVIFDVVPPLSYVGWDSFRKDWEGFFEGFKDITVYDWNDLHVEADTNLGWMHAFVHISGTLDDGKPLDMTFRDTAIFERQNGQWVVVHDHGSVPILFETGQAVMNAPAK